MLHGYMPTWPWQSISVFQDASPLAKSRDNRLSVDAVVAWVPTRFNVADDPSRRVPPVGADIAPLPVRPELWARAFRPALFPAFGAPPSSAV